VHGAEQVREQALKQERMGDREETYAAIRKMLALLNDPFTRFLVRIELSVVLRLTA
jgi:C-terminal processing protease CtpA/Prc